MFHGNPNQISSFSLVRANVGVNEARAKDSEAGKFVCPGNKLLHKSVTFV